MRPSPTAMVEPPTASSAAFSPGVTELGTSSSLSSPNMIRVVHMTSVHSAFDGRIFRKECRSLARAGYNVTIVGPNSKDTVSDSVQIKSVHQDQARISRMTRTVWRVYQAARKQEADVYH